MTITRRNWRIGLAAGKLRLSAIVASGFARASLFRFVVERSRNDGRCT
ncbi:MAG: hypothetical protein WBF03_00165 [Xanthobacteraceae bacterium]